MTAPTAAAKPATLDELGGRVETRPPPVGGAA